MQNPNHPPDHNPTPHAEVPEDSEILDHQTIGNTNAGYRSPYSAWHARTSLAKPEELISIPDPAYLTGVARKGQPWRKAVEDQAGNGLPLPPTYGPLQLPDAFDPEFTFENPKGEGGGI